ncbi:hypothetical protein [Croceicoccus sp. YJ47]|uniref:hypothetical protein n=1 Tax=Croceicoccus sp. YJ47 TaxID=2798724 RepID=UPI001923D359|nr:hypothetical protein [Croceicoccus sp. YJ47]QQN73553.1 hypothetical protein JD971_12180 [Croceicoccus sp. YJ47]
MTGQETQPGVDTPEAALARLDHALARLEQAATRPTPHTAELDDLRRQRDAMRDRVGAAIREIDTLIAGLDPAMQDELRGASA